MFAKACSEAIKFTRPIVSLFRFDTGEVKAGIGSCIILNQDGWILTAAHVLAAAIKIQNDSIQRANYEKAVEQIESNRNIPRKTRQNMLRNLGPRGQWIKNYSFIFPGSTAQITGNSMIDLLADIGVARISTLDGLDIKGFPTFPKMGQQITPGTSLCTLGFPFHALEAKFDESSNQFKVDQLPTMVFFPSEGIHTRNVMIADPDTKRQVPFIETSSPGLKGQSGGPIYDVDGKVWALQSRTAAYSLDIAPVIKENNKEFKEHQFIQVGMGCHTNHICDFLSQNKISFNLES